MKTIEDYQKDEIITHIQGLQKRSIPYEICIVDMYGVINAWEHRSRIWERLSTKNNILQPERLRGFKVLSADMTWLTATDRLAIKCYEPETKVRFTLTVRSMATLK